MEAQINHKFSGTINGVEINDEQVYYTTEYIMGELESTKGIAISDRAFTEALSEVIDRTKWKEENFNAAELEHGTLEQITSEKTLKDFSIKYEFGDNYYAEEFNKDLKAGKYEYLLDRENSVEQTTDTKEVKEPAKESESKRKINIQVRNGSNQDRGLER